MGSNSISGSKSCIGGINMLKISEFRRLAVGFILLSASAQLSMTALKNIVHYSGIAGWCLSVFFLICAIYFLRKEIGTKDK